MAWVRWRRLTGSPVSREVKQIHTTTLPTDHELVVGEEGDAVRAARPSPYFESLLSIPREVDDDHPTSPDITTRQPRSIRRPGQGTQLRLRGPLEQHPRLAAANVPASHQVMAVRHRQRPTVRREEGPFPHPSSS